MEDNSNYILSVCSKSIAKKVKRHFPSKDFHKFKPIKISITEEVGILETFFALCTSASNGMSLVLKQYGNIQ